MPKYNKTLDELKTRFDKWLYVIKNLNKLDEIPEKLRERIFEKLFETAEIAKFTPAQVESYEDSLKYYRDLKNTIDTARDEGKEEGIKEGELKSKKEIAKNLLSKGLNKTEIAEITGLDSDTVSKLLSV